MPTKKRVLVAGHQGMVGSAIVRQFEQRNDIELVVCTRNELDLVCQQAVADFFESAKIDEVYLAEVKEVAL